MLPLTHLFDSYRAGFAAIRVNLKPVLVMAAVMFATSIYWLYGSTSTAQPSENGFSVFFSGMLFLALDGTLISAMVLLFHATFLSQSLRREAMGYLDWPRFWRVTFRLLGIAMLSCVPIVLVLVVLVKLIGPEAEPAALQDRYFDIVYLLGFEFSLILVTAWLGLRIPQIVARPKQRELLPKLRGRQPFRAALLPLLCGPGLLLVGTYALTPILDYPNDPSLIEIDLRSIFLELTGTVSYIFSVAMTAAILSDTYLRFSGDSQDADVARDPS